MSFLVLALGFAAAYTLFAECVVDRLEGFRPDCSELYRRALVPAQADDDGGTAWVYHMPAMRSEHRAPTGAGMATEVDCSHGRLQFPPCGDAQTSRDMRGAIWHSSTRPRE